MQPNQTSRVIYAKLTSTGAYDVVACTPDIPLDAARALAEQLLPGNPPLDAGFDELIGYVRLDAAHLVLRFARYDWRDGDRGDVYSTDIVRMDDAAFRRIRCNAFAAVQRGTRVFDVLTALDEVQLPEAPPSAELARIAELLPVADAARHAIAAMLAADAVLLAQPSDRAAIMELFTLLLPPSLRTQLTFLTDAFRVPSLIPRVTLVDRHAANLRDGRWTMLPSADVAVHAELANQLVQLAAEPDILSLAHELHDEAAAADAPLRTAVARLLRFADVARALNMRDTRRALELISADPDALAPALQRLRTLTDAGDFQRSLFSFLQSAPGSFVRIVANEAIDASAVAALADALPSTAPPELVLALAGRAAATGDANSVVSLLARDHRAVAAHLTGLPAALPDPVLQLIDDLQRVGAPSWDLNTAVRLIDDAAACARVLDARRAELLDPIIRSAIDDALHHAVPQTRSIPAARRLHDAGFMRERDTLSPGAAALVAAALVDAALDAGSHGAAADLERAATHASRSRQAARELILRRLDERGTTLGDLAALPGADPLIDLLGGSAAHARAGTRIVDALRRAATDPDAIGALAGAVHAAHTQQLRITPASDLSRQVIAALHAFAETHERSTPAAELCLELLSVITPPQHMTDLEDAALGGSMTVRLRRLDRSIAVCRAAEDEKRYDRIAEALESGPSAIDQEARQRLRSALGTGGLSRRIMKLVSSVVDKEAS